MHPVLSLYDEQMRRDVPPDGPGVRVERTAAVVRQTGAADDWNGVLWSRLTADTADAEIAAQIAHYGGLGLGFEWKHYSHDEPADLAGRLLAAGFTAEEPEALMVASTAGLSADAPAPSGVELRPVTDAAGVELVVAVHEEAFGAPGDRLRHQLLAQLAHSPDTVAAVVAVADGRPVSSARLELVPGRDFAGLWGGGTVPAWRGRGVYRALVAYRARIATARGYGYLQVDASDMSRPILERLGFERLAVTTPYVYAAR
ncbi:GNAT family N-acetyltransferase [Streptomyces sp. NPDC051940]|uniref:GNAT family N-acetyltransferase n=1 Tax=Streptomyces sp. NPDC051940 TaxID=3155675 RepID=UPI00341C1FC7